MRVESTVPVSSRAKLLSFEWYCRVMNMLSSSRFDTEYTRQWSPRFNWLREVTFYPCVVGFIKFDSPLPLSIDWLVALRYIIPLSFILYLVLLFRFAVNSNIPKFSTPWLLKHFENTELILYYIGFNTAIVSDVYAKAFGSFGFLAVRNEQSETEKGWWIVS